VPTKLLLTLLLAAAVLLVPAAALPLHTDGEAQASSGGCQYENTIPQSSTTLRRSVVDDCGIVFSYWQPPDEACASPSV
jgi:hypothetical protein